MDFGSLSSHNQVYTRTKCCSSPRHAAPASQRQASTDVGQVGEMRLLRLLYITLLRHLRHQYLEDLLEMQAICTLLCSIHSPAQKQMRTLQRLNERHLLPIIEKLQEPKAAILKRQICQRDINSLTMLKDLMGPFIQEFSQTAHALRRHAFQARPIFDAINNAAAPAA